MSLYRYKVLEKSGLITKEVGNFPSLEGLKETVQEQGNILLSHGLLGVCWWKKISLQEQGIFCGHMAQFLGHQLSLLHALATYGSVSKKHKPTMTLVHQQLTQGISLGDALGHVQFLDPLMISSIKIAEGSGALVPCFKTLQRYAEQRYQLMERIRKALYYPFLLSSFLMVLCLFFLPSFITSMEGFLDQVQCSEKRTTLMVVLPSLLQVSMFLIFLWLIGLGLKHSPWRVYYDLIWAKIPFKKLLFLNAFFQTLSLQIESGIHLMTALKLQVDHTQNLYDKKRLIQMIHDMENGDPFSTSFQRYFKGDGLLLHLLKLGEETGTMGESFEKSTHYLTHSLERQTAFFVEILEPLFLLLIGCVLGWVAFSLFSPLYETLGGMAL